MATNPPRGPGDRPPPPPRRGYWNYYNRPYAGCGCLYTILLFILIWWLLSLLFAPLRWWEYRRVEPVEPVESEVGMMVPNQPDNSYIPRIITSWQDLKWDEPDKQS